MIFFFFFFCFNNRCDLTSGGLILNASAIFAYNSFTLVNPSILPVGLPWASCVWKTSLGRRLAGGGGSPAPFTADLLKLPAPACPPLTSSLSTKCSFVDLFFFLHGPRGIFCVFGSLLDVGKEKKSPSRCYNIEVANLLRSKPNRRVVLIYFLLFLKILPSFLSSPVCSSDLTLFFDSEVGPSLAGELMLWIFNR